MEYEILDRPQPGENYVVWHQPPHKGAVRTPHRAAPVQRDRAMFIPEQEDAS